VSSEPQFPEPPERPRPSGRWTDPLSGRLGPWVDWFGLGRLIATAVTVVAVVAGGWWLLRSPAPPIEAGLPLAATTTIAAGTTTTPADATGTAGAAATATTLPTVVVVHVAGAVASPGVYELPAGARVDAALAAAGGPLAGADPGALNLAAPLADGTRVHVPMVGEAVAPAPTPAVAVAPGATASPGPIDLNQATAAELDALPGIGPATAQAIVDHRTTKGPFASVDDLEAVRGIGPAKLDAIRALVTV
jgi:competence protein ComEA